MAKRPEDLTNRIFGRLTAIHSVTRGRQHAFWYCHCECGGHTTAQASNLRRGFSRSCGCLSRERIAGMNRTHGMTKRPEYAIWQAAKRRCFSPNDPHYADYGGRGITMCSEWRDDFAAFFRDMGPRPSRAHSLDRFPNNDGHYEASNTRWATRRQQMNNTRANRHVSVNGQTLTVTEGARTLGIQPDTLKSRLLLGWSAERAIQQPIRQDRYVTFNGKTMRIFEWAQATGLTKEAIRKRLKLGWTVERALTAPANQLQETRQLILNGVSRSFGEWSRLTGISRSTLFMRMGPYGWSVERALTTPVR